MSRQRSYREHRYVHDRASGTNLTTTPISAYRCILSCVAIHAPCVQTGLTRWCERCMKGAENISLFVICGDGAKHGHAPWRYNDTRIACGRARFPRVVGATPRGACARDDAWSPCQRSNSSGTEVQIPLHPQTTRKHLYICKRSKRWVPK